MHSSGVWSADFTAREPRYFDYVRCSMDIGNLTDLTLETDSLRTKMERYWVSPNGQLFVIDYNGTHDFLILGEDDPEYDHKYSWRNYDVIPNGSHGVVAPVDFTGPLHLKVARYDQVKGPRHCTLVFNSGQCDS